MDAAYYIMFRYHFQSFFLNLNFEKLSIIFNHNELIRDSKHLSK